MRFLISALCLCFFVALVAAQQANLTNTLVYGPGTTTAVAGVPATFYLQLRDNNMNNVNSCPSGSNPFQIRLSGPNTNTSLASSCSGGRYTSTYNTKYAGKLKLTVAIAATGQIIPNGTFTPTLNPGPIYPGNSIVSGVASGFQGIVGQTYTFQVTPFDQYNNPITSCPNSPAQWTVTLTGATPGSGSITSCNSTTGVYYGKFTALQSGRYEMTIQINNGYVKGGPFSLAFNPGPLYPPNCEFKGPTTVYAGENNTFNIIPYDKYNNLITVCANNLTWNVTLQVAGRSYPVSYDGCDKSSGVYTLSYKVTTATNYNLVVLINGQSIAEPQVAITVTAARQISASKTTASGPGLINGTAGFPSVLSIHPSDVYGNPNTRCDADWSDFTLGLTATLNNSQQCGGTIVGCNSTTGAYTATWTCTIATNYSLVIDYQTKPISGAPFYPFVFPGYLNGPTTYATGPGLTTAYAGVRTYVYLDPHDQYGNQIMTCDSPTFNASLLSVTVTTNNQDGLNITGRFENCTVSPAGVNITVSYLITSIDLTILSIQYQSNPIYLSPFPLTTYPGPPAAGFCNATGPGLVGSKAGHYGVFQVSCTDKYRNPISQCLPLDLWFVNLTSPSVDTLSGEAYKCTNTSDTSIPSVTYLRYNQTVAGEYSLNFGYEDTPLNPYSITVTPDEMDPTNTIAQGDGVSSHHIQAGNRTQFILVARDRWGNKITQCFPASYFKISSYPQLRNRNNVTYFYFVPCSQTANVTQVQYFSTLASDYTIHIALNGTQIQDSPYNVTIIAGPIDSRTITASGPGRYSAQAGIPAQITLNANDQYANPINYCEGNSTWSSFVLDLVKSDNKTVTVSGHVYSCSQGTYMANYTAYRSGTYNLSISYQQTEIATSPYFPVVSPGSNNDSMAYVVVLTDTTVAGEIGSLVVVPRDSYGNNLSSCTPSLQYTAQFTGVRAGQTGHVTNHSTSCNNDGTYTIIYNLTWATSWNVDVYGSQNNVSNSPVSVSVVPADIFAGNSYLNNPPTNVTLVIGQQDPYTLTVADVYENNVTTCPQSNVTVADWQVYTHNTKRDYQGTITCSGNGVYTITFTALKVGLYHLFVVYKDVDLAGSPYYPLNYTYGYPSSKSFADGPGVDSDSLIAGQTTYFNIHTFNQYNISIESCPPAPFSSANWTVTFDQSYDVYRDVTTLQVGECNPEDGSFPATYTPNRARKYSITIQLDGSDITLDPYTPTVVPAGIDPYMTIISGLSNRTSDNGTFTIQPRDRFGNNETSVNKDDFQVTLSPTCVESNITTTESDGQILVTYSVTEGGVYCPAIVYYVNGIRTNVPLNGTIHAIGGTACNSSCNYQGYCFRNVAPSTVDDAFSCSCFQGWTGLDCSDKMSSKYPLSIGPVVGLIVGLAILMFIIGLILGYVIFKFLPSRRGGYSSV